MMWCQIICIGGMFICFVLAVLLDGGNKKD